VAAQEVSFGAIAHGFWKTKAPSPTGSRGEGPVRGLGIDEVIQKLKQFADIVYGF